MKRPHFLVLFAALLYMDGDLPSGKLNLADFEATRSKGLADSQTIQDNLERLNRALSDADAADTGIPRRFP